MKYRCDDREYEGDPAGAKHLEDGSWIVNGKRVWVARTLAGIEAWCEGRAWRLEPAEAARRKSQGAGADITSPMTGKVAKVLVKPGAEVAVGQVLVIVEAMKMEYRVVAPRAGHVAAVKVQEGQLVEMGAVMVDLKE